MAMKIHILILLSALVQFSAAFLAFRMIRITKHVPAWILISSALLLMGIRRLTTLLSFVLPGIGSTMRGTGAEIIALFISILMLSSVILIRHYFIRQNRQKERLSESEKEYRDLSDHLEQRVEQRTRELLHANYKLKEYSQIKSEFLSKMSHELRTPLNAVIGFSDILISGMDGELTHEQKEDVKLIFNSAQHLLELINDVLDFSKLEAGRISLNPDRILMSQATSEALSDFLAGIHEKGLTVHDEIPSDFPPVYADPARLKQIIRNLISNAVKFTDQGSITLQAIWTDREGRRLSAAPPEGRGFIQMSVIDTGIGISDKNLSQIFHGFHQLESGPTRPYEGTGLGLAITQGLVELHGGKIGVESQPDHGSRFWFTLPTYEIKVKPEGQSSRTSLSA